MKDLEVFSTVRSLRERLESKPKDAKVAFVATMGALHHGHIALVKEGFSMAETVVVSIFVNPSQFNNPEDLEKYPRSLEQDIELLKAAGDVIVFAPPVEEVYPAEYQELELDLGNLETVMEGTFRPGHFKGVVNVVKRFFDIIEPDYALFGMKDFQQLSVIQFMVETLRVPVEVVGCETVREPSGLASSSRNKRLSESELKDAEYIFKTISHARSLVQDQTPVEVRASAIAYHEESPLKLEYLEIVDPRTLMPIEEWVEGARICIAAFCGGVRLIDNAALIE